MKRSKKYTAARKQTKTIQPTTIAEAIEAAKKSSYSKFTGSLEIIINYSIPSKFQNDVIRGSIVFPNKFGESKKVAVLANSEDQKKAKGADIVGEDDLIKEIEAGKINFDVLITTPDMMAKMAKLGKVLGPRGLMPNPKNETVTKDIERVVASYKSGKIDYRINDQGAIKMIVGKLDQSIEELQANLMELVKVTDNDTKKFGPGRYKSVYICPTMGPSVKIDMSKVLKEI
jgi:large subunit ribosomal protein L1